MVDSGYESDGGSDYEEEVNNISDDSLLLSSCFTLMSTHTISNGLSIRRYFEPQVNIQSAVHRNVISLNHLEWKELASHLNNFINNLGTPMFIRFDSNIMLRTMSTEDGNQRVLLAKNGVCQWFTVAEVFELLKIEPYVTLRLNFLLNLELYNFYLNFLDKVNELLVRSNYAMNVMEIVLLICNATFSIETYCIFELYCFYNQFLLADLYIRRLE